MTKLSRLLAFLLALAAISSARAADSFTPAQRAEIVHIMRDALKQDPTILRDAFAALQARADGADKARLLARGAAGLVRPGDPVEGNPHGSTTIVEFFDVRCPFCRRMEPDMAALLRRDHRVKLVLIDLPILGPASVLASRALLAAQQQGGYAKLRAALMTAPPDITEAAIEQAARANGLDWARLRRDMAAPAVMARLKANLALADQLGIDGTPALVAGRQIVPGAVGLSDLEKLAAAN
ncbi:MAG: DsbA family protein [Rhodospirillales bacterium]|nr:DsbA family protein [Rhodospirillales bacterium]